MKKTIVVTGASRGIGFELVQLASLKEYRVYALSRNADKIPVSKNLIPVNLDITSDESLNVFAKHIEEQGIVIDALVNNAGTLINQSFAKTTTEDFESVYKVNVFGLASITRFLLPYIKRKGHVVNITSMGGLDGSSKFPGLSAYSSSKGAVSILTELLAEEYKVTGPSFNGLALGAIQTEMLEQAFPDFKAPLSANEIAAYILQFALEGQRFYNGKILPVSSSTP